MKRNPFFLWSYFGIVLLSIILFCGSLISDPGTPETESRLETTEFFMVRSQDGQVVICRNNDTEPIMVLDISLGSLPAYDRERISAGMRLENLTELEQFIEDFDS